MTYVSQLYHKLSPLSIKNHRRKMGAVHSLMYCREGSIPIERENPFRKEMLEWVKKKEKHNLTEESNDINCETIKVNKVIQGSVLDEILRSRLKRHSNSKQKPMQSNIDRCSIYPKPYQSIAVRNTTSILSQTSNYLQTLRTERTEKDNPYINKKYNFLSSSSILSRSCKENATQSSTVKNIEDLNIFENRKRKKKMQNLNQRKNKTRSFGINVSVGGNLFQGKLKETQTILKFSLP